jgi:hypothetical protein
MSKKTIKKCLDAIGVTSAQLKECEDFQQEFSLIKKAYFKNILVSHPDKGGDANVFRDVQTSFEVIRDLFDKGKIKSFATAGSQPAKEYEHMYQDFEAQQTPPWEYYYEAAASQAPAYRVELAKSGRSACKQKGKAKKCVEPTIEKGEVRVGSTDQESGSYGRWNHLACWRVPSRVWLGLPQSPTDGGSAALSRELFEHALMAMNGVVLSGLNELPVEALAGLVDHVMEHENWAKLTKRSAGAGADAASPAESSESKSSSQALVTTEKKHFIVPVPDKKGAQGRPLEGKTVVMTGVFPEVGGGGGLNLGKDRVRQLVESFGGRVTSAVSGKTDILLVGKEPGYSKVSKARSSSRTQLMHLQELTDGIKAGTICAAEGAIVVRKPVIIPKFSSGYGGNSVAQLASAEDVGVAKGVIRRVVPTHTAAPKGGKQTEKAGRAPAVFRVPKNEAAKPATGKRKRDLMLEQAPDMLQQLQDAETVTAAGARRGRGRPRKVV